MASEKNMIMRSLTSYISNCDFNEIKRQIKGELIACAFDHDKGPDMASVRGTSYYFRTNEELYGNV